MYGSLYRLGRFDVQVMRNLPKEEIGRRIMWAHPLVQWLARFTRIRPYLICEPIYQEQVFFMSDRMILSPEMYGMLRREAGILSATVA